MPSVIWAGVTRVVIAQRDPNPLVNGKALQTLRRAGISVTVGVGKSEAIELNRAYNHYMRARRPYVILKAGMTLDGQIATASGEAKWITARRRDATSTAFARKSMRCWSESGLL